MPDLNGQLLATQRSFIAAVRSSAAQEQALSALSGDTARNQDLLAVYRGNAVANASKALSLAYPVIEQIVGAEFFSGLCRAFWAEQPSRSGDLNEYGEGFAAFLADFPHVADMPYLPDVARVEWMVCAASHAADHVALELARLADIPPENIGSLRFSLQPALVFFESGWPVASIWQQHQPDYAAEVEINLHKAESVAVHRQGFHARVIALSAAELSLWRLAEAERPLAEMLEAAFAIDESFDVQAALQAGFAREFVSALHP